ncbi:MAG: hypothetical protein ACE5GO_07320, partial [Anaerolineales bacterium]
MTLDTGTAILRKDRCNKLCDFLLVLVLLVGAYFRLNGVKWDEIHYLHPDERFLAMVESGITPITCLGKSIPVHECPPELKEWISLKEYFDTANSTLNPNNRSFDFFVYGTLPIFIVRYVAEWLGKIGYGDIALVGRPLSAL